jgi:hypothetical protein
MRSLYADAKALDIAPEPFEGLLIVAPSAGSFADDPGAAAAAAPASARGSRSLLEQGLTLAHSAVTSSA